MFGQLTIVQVLRKLCFLHLTLSLLPLSLAGPSYSVAWHKPLVGIPLISSFLEPAFHRVPAQNKTVLLVATRKGVVAGLNPGDGEIVWRQLHDYEDKPLIHKSFGHITVTLSGPSGSVLRLYTPHTGELIREYLLHPPLEARLNEPSNLGCDLGFVREDRGAGNGGSADIIVLTNGNTVSRIAETGVIWRWKGEKDVSWEIYTSLHVTSSAIHLLGLSHSPSWDASTGNPPRSYTYTRLTLGGSPVFTSDLSLPVPDASTKPLVVHPATIVVLHRQMLLSLSLMRPSDQYATFGGSWKDIREVSLNGVGIFVAIRDDGGAEILRAKLDGSLERAWNFSDSATAPYYSESLFSGAIDKQGNPHVARAYWSHTLGLASMHVWSAEAPGGRGMVTGFTFPFKTKEHGIMLNLALEVGIGKAGQTIPRFLITTSTGGIQLWQHEQLQWTREEGMTDLVGSIAWADALKRTAQAANLGIEDWSAKIQRHAGLIWELPFYLYRFLARFLTSAHVLVSPSTLSDEFGSRKLVLLASRSGKLFALESTGGTVVWERILGVSGAPDVLRSVKLERVLEVGGVGWVVIGSRVDEQNQIRTAVWEITPETGKTMPPPGREGTTNGYTMFDGVLVEAFVIKGAGASPNDTVVLVDERMKIHIFPDDPERLTLLSSLQSRLHFSLPSSLGRPAQLMGYTVGTLLDSLVALPAFVTPLSPYPMSTICSFVRPYQSSVASYGRVLSDKSTLYKDLNPHRVVVVTSSFEENVCRIHVIDEVHGTVLYQADVLGADAMKGCDVHAVMTENWLVYHWYELSNDVTPTKGYRIVTVEFYEGEPDQLVKSTELSSSSFSSFRVNIAQTYGFPGAVKALTTTSTKYGITLKDILIANDRTQIQSFPRALLDPRRPRGKLTSGQREELLVPFDPVVPDDPRRVVSRDLQIAGITHIGTVPTLLESTSLAFAYGLDLFLGRVSPSNTFDVLSESFNKVQLVLTVVGLLTGIFIAKPIVDRKRMQQRWYT